jgi:hypothetical protein
VTTPLPQLAAITVIADRYPDGTYGATVNVGPDLSWSMPGPRARRYALTLMELATACEHDVALYGALACKGIPDEITAAVLTDVRDARDRELTSGRWVAPLRVTTILTAEPPHRGILQVRPDGPHDGWQWTPRETRKHALQVLGAVIAADEDNRLAAVLRDGAGLPPAVVAAVIDHMQGHWPEED